MWFLLLPDVKFTLGHSTVFREISSLVLMDRQGMQHFNSFLCRQACFFYFTNVNITRLVFFTSPM